MEFRESIALDKNFITNEETKTIKHKPKNPIVKGITTVTLYNAETKEKVREVKSENIVNNVVSQLAYMDYFYNKIKGSNTNNYYTSPFEIILLTDFTGAEDATNKVFKGNIIGWADKQTAYSGTDNTRGSINLTESSLDTLNNGDLHFVFDFPTNAANGTFQTIWWYSSTKPTTTLSVNGNSNNGGIALYSGGIVLINSVSAGGSFKTIDKNSLATTGTIAPSNMPAISCQNTNSGGADYDGTNVWIVDYNNLKLHKFSGDLTSWISSVPITGWNSSTWGTINDITEFKGTILAMTSNYFIVSINEDTGACGTATDIRARCGLSSTYSNDTVAISYDGNNLIYVGNSYNGFTVLDSNFNFLSKYDSYSGIAIRKITINRENGCIYTNEIWEISLYTYGLTPGAQNLLPSPVTKTATNTMKIQYDFQVQRPW